ncbi:MAG: tetratricopeptide repeat protein, partial [Roseinatronobacter sp.]|nr:tetratricopeptide repeat protein [Roseinatronobacter sp.]
PRAGRLSGPSRPPTAAETVADLRAELNALSAAVADLARELSSGAGATQPGYDGSLIDRVERIREELTRLTGRTEELEFRIRRAIDEASNRLGDLEFRLTELEGGDVTNLAAPRPLGGSIGGAGASAGFETPQLAASESVAFDTARALADAGDYDAAAEALQQFLEFYPGSPLGADASLLLGQMHRARGAEPEAARAYLNLYLSAPDGPDAPRALLALGDSLGRLEQVAEACVMFDELRNRFTTSPEAAEAEVARLRLACP